MKKAIATIGLLLAAALTVLIAGALGAGAQTATPNVAPFRTHAFSMTANNGSSPIGSDFFTHEIGCTWDAVYGGGTQGKDCVSEHDTHFEPGWNVGNGSLGNNGWTVNKFHSWTNYYYTPGITQVLSATNFFNKTGDDAWIYAYCWNKGGFVDSSGEGHTCLRVNGGNGNSVYAGLVQQTGTGLSSITLTNNGDNNPLVGGFIADLASAAATGNITGCTNATTNTPGQCTVTNALIPSTAYGHTNADLVNTANVPAGNSKTIAVHVDGGSNAGGFINGLIYFACDDYPDFVTATVTAKDGSGNQNITANFQYSHTAGCPIFQGGTHGILDLTADRTGGGGSYRTAYIVAGAVDTAHFSYREYMGGGQGGIWPMMHNFGQAASTTLTRAANVVSTCNLPFSYSGQAITVTGATDATFNGAFTASTLDANSCASWTQTGANSSSAATVNTGGAVGGASGTGAYSIWPAAQIQSAGFTNAVVNGVLQKTFNGTLNLLPNDMHVTAGDQMFNPADPSNITMMLGAEGQYTTPPTTANQAHFSLGVKGTGVTSLGFWATLARNNNAYSMYLGGGGSGLLAGSVAHETIGPWQITHDEDAPLSGGMYEHIRLNPVGNLSAAYSWYYPRVADNKFGLLGYYEVYNAFTGRFDVVTQLGAASASFSLIPGQGFVSGTGYIGTPSLPLTVTQLRLDGTGTMPCTSANSGVMQLIPGGAGVADVLQVCAKNAAGVYAFHSIALP